MRGGRRNGGNQEPCGSKYRTPGSRSAPIELGDGAFLAPYRVDRTLNPMVVPDRIEILIVLFGNVLVAPAVLITDYRQDRRDAYLATASL